MTLKPSTTRGPRPVLLDDKSLFRDIIRAESLRIAWEKVWKNQGAAGGDGVSCRHFVAQAAKRLSLLRQDLENGTYEAGPVRIVSIPKKTPGKIRTLAIPCIRDRIVQSAIAMVLSPKLEEEFEPESFGYRPGRGVTQAVAAVEQARNAGYTHVLDADIEGFFDSVNHQQVMQRLSETMTDGPLTQLIWYWLTHAMSGGVGLAQGSPLSPLLANLALDRLDERLTEKDIRLVRFADDFVVLTKTEKDAEAAFKRVEKSLAREGLTLHRDKTQVVDFDEGFRFLGHLFVRSLALKVDAEKTDSITHAMALVSRDDATQAAERADALETEQADENRGYHPGLRVLYVLSKDRRLQLRPDALVVEQAEKTIGGAVVDWHEVIAVPTSRVDRIELGPTVELDRAIADHLVSEGIELALIDGNGETRGQLSPPVASHGARHMAQAGTFYDECRRLELARELVLGRLRSQRTQLRRLTTTRPHPPSAVTKALVHLNKTLPRGPAARDSKNGKGPLFGASSIAALMGQEGAAAKLWWPALSAFIEVPFFQFKTRRRPANGNPANICLNVLASLLQRDVRSAVLRANLHPGFGVLHSPNDYGDACAYDVIEEFRAPLAEGLFIYLVNRHIIRAGHFYGSGTERRLTHEGYRALVTAYERRVAQTVFYAFSQKRLTWRQLMLEQALRFAAHHEGRSAYLAYDMDRDRRQAKGA